MILRARRQARRPGPARAAVLAGGVAALTALAACGTTVPLTQLQSARAGGSAGTGTLSADGLDAGTTPAGAAGAATAAGAGQASSGSTAAQGDAGAAATVGAASGDGVGTVTPLPGTPARTSGATGTAGTKSPAATTAKRGAVTAAPKASTKATTAGKTSAAPVAPKTSAPISIGLVYAKPSAAAAVNGALGASTNSTINIQVTLDAFVKQINATGGISGRLLAAIDIAESGADPDADCATLTQDNHVQIAFDALYGGAGDFASCMQKAGVEVVDLVSQNDAATLRGFPNSVSLFRMNMDRAYAAVVNGLFKSGYVTPKNKIGVLMDTCTNSVAAYKNTVTPLIKSLGLTVTDTVNVDCNGSTGSESSAIAGSVLTFRGDGDDRVMIISSSEQQGLLLFGEAAGAQGYTPGYMLSSQAEASAVTPLLPAAQRDGVHGVGNLPVFDISAPTNPNGSEEAGCVADMAKQNVVPSTSDDYYYVYEGCAGFRLLAKALAANGAVTTPSVLASTFASLGSFATPGIVGDAGILSTTRQDAPASVQNFGYADSCSCLQYTSSPAAT